MNTPITPAVTATKFNAIDKIPFNMEQTPEVMKEIQKDTSGSSSSGKAKRDVISLNDDVHDDTATKKMKNDATVEILNVKEQ